MFKKTLIFLLAFGFAVSANAARRSKVHKHHRSAVNTAQMTTKVNINKADVNVLAKVKGLGVIKSKGNCCVP